ncbi:MAG: DNA polymerase IV [Clostridia bacterium]|nr:DNA polymerase IV [Clostridia bacterium]
MRYIFHCDLNNFYASVECNENPSLRGKPVAVCGSEEDRHGIVLAKNYIAKNYGIKTGDTIWQAKQKCPGIVCVTANHSLYLKYSRLVRQTYYDYTDRIEPFGIDEAWLDMTGSVKNFSEAENLASELRKRVREELGVTISVGVSFCKVFAKLGSDYKKPDATTIITPENFKEIVWPLPASDLLYVGRATAEKLQKLNIKTIGELANFDADLLHYHLGKVGTMLQTFARGEQVEEVRRFCEHSEIKSVGNSLTYYKDVVSREDISALFMLLAESVIARMKSYGFVRARNISISITDNNLQTFSKMMKMNPVCGTANALAGYAIQLFDKCFTYSSKIRALGIHVSDFCEGEQVSFYEPQTARQKQENIENAVEKLRGRFGRNSVQRAIMLTDEKLKNISIIDDHVVTPSFKEHPDNYSAVSPI